MTKHQKDACEPFVTTECLSCMTDSRTPDLVILNEILFSFHWYSKYGGSTGLKTELTCQHGATG